MSDIENKKLSLDKHENSDKNKNNYSNGKELIVIILQDGYLLDWAAAVNNTNGNHDNSRIENPIYEKLYEQLYEQYSENSDKALLYLGFYNYVEIYSQSLGFLQKLSSIFIKQLSSTPDAEILRENTKLELESEQTHEILENAPYMPGNEFLNSKWVEDIWSRLNSIFSEEIKVFEGTVAQFLKSYNPNVNMVGRVFFHLVENKQGEYPFAFMATYASSVTIEGKSKHLPLKNALVEYKGDQKKLLELLSTVNKASQSSEMISELVESGEIFHPIGLSVNEAYIFLKEIPLYEEAGILCRIPKWWKSKSSSMKLGIEVGTKPASKFGFDALVDFNAQISMDGESFTPHELKQLLAESEGLAFIKGKWMEVNHHKLKETLKAFEQARKLMNKEDMTLLEAMQFQLNASKFIDVQKEKCELEITNGEWLNSIITRLTHPEEIEHVSCGKAFNASLRPYQQKGLAWLNMMKTLGLGACLADDMGLGKTIQVIALLNSIKEKKDEKALLVVPASLIGNWVNEISRFAPEIRYYVLHASENNTEIILQNDDKSGFINQFDIFITTYGMLMRQEWIKEIKWDMFIIDEAQAIKNPGTKQTKAVKQVRAACKIAMTGTPIENRLSDLWSLFDFLNKGLLGSAKEFTDFTKSLQLSQDGYAKLKRVASPFILRRLKTDKNVISDLPEKVEMKSFSALTKRQAALYTKLVEEIKNKIESADEGIERKGLILASLMKFKQICNHPDQYLGQEVYAENESGKYEILREICETIYEKRERVLVFTQFKEMTEPIRGFLENVFEHKGLVLHGGTPIAKRKEIVDKFQGQAYVPFLVLSIKAGGVGLNLTAANHVIHFDRWWNPAVENQATDRAFRIGQKKNVIVHKFITRGTIEEKIDKLIEEKTQLSKDIIPDMQESWITELDNKQLMDLFKLSV